MKTKTRSEIIELIKKNQKMRPVELREHLNISPQIIHRHLRSLVEQEVLEAIGSPPLTYYALAGIPDFEAVSHWINAKTLDKNPQQWVCETREIFNARLPHLKSFMNNGLSENILPLVISIIGEIGNNSFDHNLGQWKDVPGCWFESQVTGHHLWVWIADRGQGIFQSLIKIHKHLKDDQTALKAAFETIISGRAPEQRGNGLKYVKNNLSTTQGCGVACISGTGHVQYGEQGEKCAALLSKNFSKVNGTFTLMTWRLK
ncbi:MAG: winged helix-turn-helix domain-containing protein [Elusimicrobiota bacterium]